MAEKKGRIEPPKTRAKTAYGVLSDVASLAIHEPLRIAMATWRTLGAPHEHRETNSIFPLKEVVIPQCGTVGCIGGWTETLLRERCGTFDHAPALLGLDRDQDKELFFNHDLCNASNQQTMAHARAVVRHIRKFQQKYRKQLLAKKV